MERIPRGEAEGREGEEVREDQDRGRGGRGRGGGTEEWAKSRKGTGEEQRGGKRRFKKDSPRDRDSGFGGGEEEEPDESRRTGNLKSRARPSSASRARTKRRETRGGSGGVACACGFAIASLAGDWSRAVARQHASMDRINHARRPRQASPQSQWEWQRATNEGEAISGASPARRLAVRLARRVSRGSRGGGPRH